jgi:hypothetical protein
MTKPAATTLSVDSDQSDKQLFAYSRYGRNPNQLHVMDSRVDERVILSGGKRGSRIPVLVLTLVVSTMFLMAACGGNGGPAAPSTPTPAPPTPSSPPVPQLLVDASRDGGVWWFGGSPNHQGAALAGYLRSEGFEVTELEQGATITFDLLSTYAIVIRANESFGYSSSEINAYQAYVRDGGDLLLLGDFVRPSERDTLGESFGISFRGVSRGENVLEEFSPHPITLGVTRLSYRVGSGLLEQPPGAELLGFLSRDTYLDLNDNGRRDGNEPFRAAALGAMSFGEGKIVFCGDTNLWQTVPQPLVRNTMDWLR